MSFITHVKKREENSMSLTKLLVHVLFTNRECHVFQISLNVVSRFFDFSLLMDSGRAGPIIISFIILSQDTRSFFSIFLIFFLSRKRTSRFAGTITTENVINTSMRSLTKNERTKP